MKVLTKKIIITILGFSVFLLLTVGSFDSKDSGGAENKKDSSKKNEAESKKEYKIGEVFTSKNFEMKVVSLKKKRTVGGEYIKKDSAKGASYICIVYQFKNISDKPINMFSAPDIKLVDSGGVEYETSTTLSTYYKNEVGIDMKGFDDINPSIVVKDAEVFEISTELWNKGGWKIQISESWDDYIITI